MASSILIFCSIDNVKNSDFVAATKLEDNYYICSAIQIEIPGKFRETTNFNKTGRQMAEALIDHLDHYRSDFFEI